MSPLEPLAPDQRAVVALVLQRERSYDEIAGLLGIPVEAVRSRARAALRELAPDNGLPGEVTGPLADYLLGQQAPTDAEATRGLLAESEPARAWARDVAAQLEDVAPRGLPEVPAGRDDAVAAAAEPSPPAAEPEPSSRAAEPSAPGPRPRPLRAAPAPRAGAEATPASSRLGGALLIAAVLAAVAVVLFLVLGGGDDDAAGERAASSPAATATPTPTPEAPKVADTIPLRSTIGAKAKGRMTLYVQDQRLLFALEGSNVPPSRQGAAYAVWFTGPGDRAHRLGFTNAVGQDGRLAIQGPSEKDLDEFPKLYATYARVVVSEETFEAAKRPTRVILAGKLPSGRRSD